MLSTGHSSFSLRCPAGQLLDYQAYKGGRLTETGTRVALEVIRHHRLIELYLSKQLGMPWDQVHDEAEKLEPAVFS
jgi:DtxR family Mn-dependent transcriptional regulator